jgi:hypothetical protein
MRWGKKEKAKRPEPPLPFWGLFFIAGCQANNKKKSDVTFIFESSEGVICDCF